MFVGREVSRGPEENGTQAVKTQSHENCDLVPFSLHDLSRDGGEQEVTATKVNNLKSGTLQLGDIEDRLEMLVQDIE